MLWTLVYWSFYWKCMIYTKFLKKNSPKVVGLDWLIKDYSQRMTTFLIPFFIITWKSISLRRMTLKPSASIMKKDRMNKFTNEIYSWKKNPIHTNHCSKVSAHNSHSIQNNANSKNSSDPRESWLNSKWKFRTTWTLCKHRPWSWA